MIKLLVADHHPIIRKGLELLFLTSPVIKVEGGVDDGESIFDFLKSNSVDILISEIDLPKLNGITALRRLKKEYPDVKVLMYSTHPEEVYAMSSIKAGASGYISKTSNILTLREAILKVDQGGIYLSNDLTHRLAFGERVQRTGSFYKKLSTREVEVLKLLSIGKKNKEIAKELDINEKTVSTYKARLMKKLQASNLVELLNQAKLLES